MKKNSIGEFDLIREMTARLGGPPPGVIRFIGDDAAVLEPPQGKMLFSCDMMVEGIHFLLDFITPFELGWKALAVNVSDIAAMGGVPRYAVVSLGVGQMEELDFYREVYRGIRAAGEKFGAGVVGGDTVRTKGPLVIDVAIVGEAENPVLRRGACHGDVVAVTGSLGASAAGLEYFLKTKQRGGSPVVEEAVRAHLLPFPRVREAQAALKAGGVTAMIDISDGLAGDIAHICRESGVRAVLDAEMIPVSTCAADIAKELDADPLKWALHGGEDYELLMTVAPASFAAVQEAVCQTGIPLTQIGRVEQGDCEALLQEEGKITRLSRGGYQHFR